MKDNETQLVKACISMLHVLGVPAWRNNTGSTRIGKRFVKFGMKGSSDVFGVLPPYGRFLAVECKMPGKKPTPEQRQFLDAVNEAGGLGVVVYTVDEVEQIVACQHELNEASNAEVSP